MKAVLLCAGKGTRLYPLTETRQKGMIKIAGKPIIYHLLSAIKKMNIHDVIIVVGEFKEQIIDYFGNGSEFGLNIDYVEQKEQKGTGEESRVLKATSLCSYGCDYDCTQGSDGGFRSPG